MERPIKLRSEGREIEFGKISPSELAGMEFKVPYASAAKARLKDAVIWRQSVSTYLCYIDQYELESTKSLSINFIVSTPAFFLFFMLNGNARFVSSEQIEIANPTQGVCYATFNQPGSYMACFEAGKHDLLYLALNIEWLKTLTNVLNGLKPFIYAFSSGKLKFGILPIYPITKNLYIDLKRLQSLKYRSLAELEGLIHLSVSRIMEHYHDLLVKDRNGENPLAYRTLELIRQNYTESKISIPWLSKKLYTTRSTLTKSFKAEFNITPGAYIVHLKMTMARDLLLEGQTIPEVSYNVGYFDVHSFGVRYKTTFGYPPNQTTKRSGRK